MKRTKTILIALTAVAVSMAVTLCVSCNETNQRGEEPEQMVMINPPSVDMVPGDTYQLEVNVYPDAELAAQAQWSSGNSAVATVDGNGLVTAVSAGEAVITVDVNGTEATCDVTVLDVEVEAVLLDRSELTIAKAPDKTEQLTATILPTEASGVSVSWSTSNDTVAVVDENGVVTPVGAGEAVITAEAGGKQAKCSVTVEAIVLSDTEVQTYPGKIIVLTAQVMSNNPNIVSVEWSSSNAEIAEVDYDGWVYINAPGEVTITAAAGDMVSECQITVSEYTAPEGVGDFIYSDGSTSPALESGKTPVGVVFWVGNPTAYDEALRRDYPGCTHGLAVALDEEMMYFIEGVENPDAGAPIMGAGLWIDEHPSDEYVSIYEPEWPYNIQGYNNTKAMKAYNSSADGEQWPLAPVQALADYDKEHPTPEGASTWYIPSFQELTLMGVGEIEDFNIRTKIYSEITNWNAVYLNTKLAQLPSAELLYVGQDTQRDHMYWSSSETSDSMGARMPTRFNMALGGYGTDGLHNENKIRYVFAF